MKTILSNLKLELKTNVSGHCVSLQPGCFVFYNNAKSSLDAKQNHLPVTRRASKLKTEKLKTWNKINVGSLPCVHSSETVIADQITHDAQPPKAETHTQFVLSF